MELYNKHRVALYALDKQNGNLKLSILANSAHELNAKVGMRKVIDVIDYAVKYNLTDCDRIISSLKQNNGNLQSLYESLGPKCQYHKSQITESKSLIGTKNINTEHEQNKQSKIKIEKDFSL